MSTRKKPTIEEFCNQHKRVLWPNQPERNRNLEIEPFEISTKQKIKKPNPDILQNWRIDQIDHKDIKTNIDQTFKRDWYYQISNKYRRYINQTSTKQEIEQWSSIRTHYGGNNVAKAHGQKSVV